MVGETQQNTRHVAREKTLRNTPLIQLRERVMNYYLLCSYRRSDTLYARNIYFKEDTHIAL